MRKYASVFGLIARSSIYKILLVLCFSTGAQLALFRWRLFESLRYYGNNIGFQESFSRFDYLVGRSGVGVALAVTFIAVTVMLVLTGTQASSRVGYTLDRLSVSKRAIFAVQTVYNACAYLLLWTAELATIGAMGAMYLSCVPEPFAAPQGMLISFYQSPILHSLMPLADVLLWIRNAIILVSLSTVSARFPMIQRSGRFSAVVIALVLFIIVFFTALQTEAFNMLIVLLVCIGLTVDAMRGALKKEVSYEA